MVHRAAWTTLTATTRMVILTSTMFHPYKPTTQVVPTCTETMLEYTILLHTNTTRDCHTVTWIECHPYLKSVITRQIELLRTIHPKVDPWSTCTVRTHTEIVTDRLLILSYDPFLWNKSLMRILYFDHGQFNESKLPGKNKSNKPQRQQRWCNLFSISNGAMNLFKSVQYCLFMFV